MERSCHKGLAEQVLSKCVVLVITEAMSASTPQRIPY